MIDKTKRVFPVYEFRPLEDGNYLRYADGRWIKDDGEYDLAFVEVDNPFTYGFSVPYYEGMIWSWCLGLNWGENVKRHPNGNPWHYMTRNGKSWGKHFDNRDKHPNEVAGRSAMDKCCDLHSCANGRGPGLHIADPYIEKGLVRIRDTKKVVKFPKIFHCIYCGKLNWKKMENKLKRRRR